MMKLKLNLNKLSQLILALSFLVNTLVMPISVQGLVLCVDNDHIALELQKVSPEGSKERSAQANQYKTASTYHSDGCADVPLYQHFQHVIHGKQSRALHPVRFLPAAPAAVLPYSAQNICNSIIPPLSHTQPHMQHRVVLLI